MSPLLKKTTTNKRHKILGFPLVYRNLHSSFRLAVREHQKWALPRVFKSKVHVYF